MDGDELAMGSEYDWLAAMEAVPKEVATLESTSGEAAAVVSLSPFDAGFLVGILVGEGHFGGDGRQPQVTLRMHTDHVALFEWLMTRFPESRLYGPYDHSGRRYYQWMARSRSLREHVLPVLDRWLQPEHSGRAWQRYQQMKRTYGLGRVERRP